MSSIGLLLSVTPFAISTQVHRLRFEQQLPSQLIGYRFPLYRLLAIRPHWGRVVHMGNVDSVSTVGVRLDVNRDRQSPLGWCLRGPNGCQKPPWWLGLRTSSGYFSQAVCLLQETHYVQFGSHRLLLAPGNSHRRGGGPSSMEAASPHVRKTDWHFKAESALSDPSASPVVSALAGLARD